MARMQGTYVPVPLQAVALQLTSSYDRSEAESMLSSDTYHSVQPLTQDDLDATESGFNPKERSKAFARIDLGWWKHQMLSDRTLRGMAALTSLAAIVMWIIVIVYAEPFASRTNTKSTSVGDTVRSCEDVKTTNMVLLFLINAAATMVLGMSNTYQQLVTALRVEDIPHALEKYGDSTVGTNSPFTINHKRSGRFKSWASWLLLIVTSLPLHFLSNSFIGSAMILDDSRPWTLQKADNVPNDDQNDNMYIDAYTTSSALACYQALRTGVVLTEPFHRFGGSNDYAVSDIAKSESGIIYYNGTCVKYAGDSDIATAKGYTISDMERDMTNCTSRPGQDSRGTYSCVASGMTNTCRLNLRLMAGFILASCLTLKSIYMITINFLARGSNKTTCLTFGDVILAAATDPNLRVYNECMLNATYHSRFLVSHSCHKHCSEKTDSKTGDELGHCQKCKKFNRVNRSANLEQPSAATKMKKSLLSLLGGTTLPQLILLSFCTAALVAGTGMTAAAIPYRLAILHESCERDRLFKYSPICRGTRAAKVDYLVGGWDGRIVMDFGPSSLPTEISAMLLANTAQTVYSFLYLLLVYNVSLVPQEYSWGKLERWRRRLRCTINRGHAFEESYLLQLPKRVLFPLMAYSILVHWLLGECIHLKEVVFREGEKERSYYALAFSLYALWVTTGVILVLTIILWWAYSYVREGFIPSFWGSIRTLCAAATEIDFISDDGVMWGDLGMGEKFRHAGLSSSEVGKIHPHELYAGRGDSKVRSRVGYDAAD